MKKKLLLAIVTCLAIAILVLAFHRTEHSREKDPSGEYTAICTYRIYLSWLPMLSGQSSDKPCFVKIENSRGESMGEIPVPMIGISAVEWRGNGTHTRGATFETKVIGEWDFTTGSCYYLADDGTEIHVRQAGRARR